jgi:hypothetical protein
VSPLQGQHRLRRQAQLVGHSYPDAAIADVEGEIARRIFQFSAPVFQLNARQPGRNAPSWPGKPDTIVKEESLERVFNVCYYMKGQFQTEW